MVLELGNLEDYRDEELLRSNSTIIADSEGNEIDPAVRNKQLGGSVNFKHGYVLISAGNTHTVINKSLKGAFDGFFFLLRGQADAWTDSTKISLILDGSEVFNATMYDLVGTLANYPIVEQGFLTSKQFDSGPGGYANIALSPNIPIIFEDSIKMEIVNNTSDTVGKWGSLMWRDL